MKIFTALVSNKIKTGILIAILLGGTILNLTIFSNGLSQAHAATTNSSDVQYSTTLDYSPTDVLISEGGFTASTTFDCGIASLTCNPVSSATTALIPSALDGQSSYFMSPDNSEVISTTYTPGQSPTENLYSIENNALVLKATIPPLNSLITRVLWGSAGDAFVLEESDGSLQKYTVSTNSLATLTSSLPSGASWITISPDARYIAYYIPATLSRGKRTFGVLDTTADKIYSLDGTVAYWDLLTEGVRIFAFSPDSSKLLYLDDRSGYQTLYEVSLSDLPTEGLTGTQVTTKPYSIEDMQWENNSTIVFSANRSTPMQWSLYELNLDSYALMSITDWVSYDAPLEKIGPYILFNSADANGRLPKLYNTVTKKVESFSIPGVSQTIIGTTNQVVTSNGLYGVYMKPSTNVSSVAPSTLLVWLHGGPDRQDSIEYNSYMSYGGYDWVLNQVSDVGVPVLKLDYPGSLGYGRASAESIVDGVGTVDASSTMKAITEFASLHGYKDIYVMGNSYGGYLALKLLTAYPDQIQGAFSLSGVTDWQTLLTNNPSSIFSVDFNGAPNATNQPLYDAASIVNNIAAIGKQKIILIQGDTDDEVPYSQSVLMNAALVAAGKDVEYTTLPGESHIYENPASYTLVCNKALELVGLPTSSLCTMHS